MVQHIKLENYGPTKQKKTLPAYNKYLFEQRRKQNKEEKRQNPSNDSLILMFSNILRDYSI